MKQLFLISTTYKYLHLQSHQKVSSVDVESDESLSKSVESSVLVSNLVPNLTQKSVVVIDNAPYHNKQENKTPSCNSRKVDIMQWLQEKKNCCSDSMRKVELLELVKLHKLREKSFTIDRIIRSAGHEVIRLPPYHCDLNAIEFVWAQVKHFIRDQNVTGNASLTKLRQLCEGSLRSISPEKWEKTCAHIKKKIEDRYWVNDGILENEID